MGRIQCVIVSFRTAESGPPMDCHPLAYWYRRPDSFDVTSKQGREGRGLGELASRLLPGLTDGGVAGLLEWLDGWIGKGMGL